MFRGLAASVSFQHSATRRWLQNTLAQGEVLKRFNTQPPEGGCLWQTVQEPELPKVSTLSHPKVAAAKTHCIAAGIIVSTLSHPKVAALIVGDMAGKVMFQHSATRRWLPDAQGNYKPGNFVSTLSHPKVAADVREIMAMRRDVSTHSHPKVAAGVQ